MRAGRTLAALVAVTLLAAACGSTRTERTVSGAGIGAVAGAGAGALLGPVGAGVGYAGD